VTTDEEPSTESVETPADIPDEPSQSVAASSVDEARTSGAGRLRPAAGWLLSNVRPIVLIALVVATVGLAAGIFFSQYRPDRYLDHSAADGAIRAASDGVVAALSYSSDSLDRDIANGKLHLTGNFLDYYIKFTRDVVSPAVREKHLAQQATVLRAAVEQLHPDSAVVLTYVNETTKSAEKKDPLTTPTAIRITLQKVDGAWLISKLDPVA
jgi:Mce-associated membrane protein